jgi:hypothetical protein
VIRSIAASSVEFNASRRINARRSAATASGGRSIPDRFSSMWRKNLTFTEGFWGGV